MLKGIDARISPDLLRVLARMGHGDEIVIADANFPSAAVARHTVAQTELRIDCDAVAALRAILSLLPIDSFEPDPVLTMQVVDDPAAVPAYVGALVEGWSLGFLVGGGLLLLAAVVMGTLVTVSKEEAVQALKDAPVAA